MYLLKKVAKNTREKNQKWKTKKVYVQKKTKNKNKKDNKKKFASHVGGLHVATGVSSFVFCSKHGMKLTPTIFVDVITLKVAMFYLQFLIHRHIIVNIT